MLPIILAGALMVGLIVGLVLLQQSRWYQHRQLFSQLCRVHRLDRRSRRLLRQLESQLRLPFPAWVFVDPRCLAAARKLADIPPGQLLLLQTKLFGSQPAQPSPANSPETPAVQ